jgi:hypothetical protein
MIQISGENSKRGEILFPKRGIAIFISVELKSKKDARNQKGGKMLKYQLVKDGYREVKSRGNLKMLQK